MNNLIDGKCIHKEFYCNNRSSRPKPLITPEDREQNKKDVKQVDHQNSDIKKNNPSCPSTHVHERETKQKPKANFSGIIQLYHFTKINRASKRFAHNYNGTQHSQYAILVKNFTQANKQPLSTHQKNILLPLIKTHSPTTEWIWRNLATPFHAWTTAGLFTYSKNLSPRAHNIQQSLFEAFIDKILEKYTDKRSLPDLTTRCISNLLSSMAKLMAEGLDIEKAPKFKTAVITLWLHVETATQSQTIKNRFNPLEASSLLWSMTKIALKGLDMNETLKLEAQKLKEAQKLEKPPELKEPLELKGTLALKMSVTVIWQTVATQEGRDLTSHGLSNLLWALANQVAIELLEVTPELNTLMTMLLNLITEQNYSIDITIQGIGNLLWSIARLVEIGLLSDSSQINTPVSVLLHLITQQTSPFSAINISTLIGALAGLGDCELLNSDNSRAFENIIIMLLPLVTIKADPKEEEDPFSTHHAVATLRSIAKIVDSGRLHDSTELNTSVAALLLHVANNKDCLIATDLSNLLFSLAKLDDCTLIELNNKKKLKKTILTLLAFVKTKAESKKEEDRFSNWEIAMVVYAIAKQAYKGLNMDTASLKNLVTSLLSHVGTNTDEFSHKTIANLLWGIPVLGELIEIRIAVSLSVYLVNVIDTYDNFAIQEMALSLKGLLMCRARLPLSDKSNESVILQDHIEQLFNRMKDNPLNVEHEKIIIIQASIWLGVPFVSSHNYAAQTSKYQDFACQALRKKFSSLNIQEEKILHALPPVYIYLPDQNIVIEVQGPYHYVGNDCQTRNGSTLLKKALLEKLEYCVIEIRMSKISPSYDISSMKKCIDKIQKKINSSKTVNNHSVLPISDTEQESSDDEYFSAHSESGSFLDETEQKTTEQKITEKKKEGWEVVGRKKKNRKIKAKHSLLPH